MARPANKLTALKVQKAKTPGMYADGQGLYLRVTKSGTQNWVWRYMLAGQAHWMGLGPVSLFSLQEARAKAQDARLLHYQGIDPIGARRTARQRARLDAAKAITFRACAAAYIAAHEPAWRNAKHKAQWKSTLATYAEPVLGALSVQDVDTPLVVRVLQPLWHTKPETGARLRQRIEAILDWGRTQGYRQGENPARWQGHLENALPARKQIKKVKHHAALPFGEIGAFMTALRHQDGIAARALEFAILTATRTGEVLGACWKEIDFTTAIWTIPGERMKGGREHRVPLCRRTLDILTAIKPKSELAATSDAPIFHGMKIGKPLSNMALLMVLRRMGRDDVTAHGFRSTFRDFVSERTTFPPEVAEMALAHAVGNKVEAAYRRGDLFEKRSRLMITWADYCTSPAQTPRVTPLRRPAQ